MKFEDITKKDFKKIGKNLDNHILAQQNRNFEEEYPTLAKVHKKGCTTFTDKCLMKCCLDKKKVIDAIENILHDLCDVERIDKLRDDLKKELRLIT